MTHLDVTIPAGQFRSMPIPGQTYKGRPSKMSSCFVRATDVPQALEDWMDVNPRIPATKKDRSRLAGTVARRIVSTLRDNPEIFALKNQGIFLLVDSAEHVVSKGGEGALTLRLRDRQKHGIVNGGHTFFAIRQAVEEDEDGSPERAWVRLHILEQVDPDNILDLAEGLNRSLQVDDASLMNLEKRFDDMKDELRGLPGADAITYRMGDTGPIDVQEVLTYVSAFNLHLFPDSSTQPNGIFGQPAKVLSLFGDDGEEEQDPKKKAQKELVRAGFELLMPHVHDILVLWERVCEECATDSTKRHRLSRTGRSKDKDGKVDTSTKSRPALFAEGREIPRKLPTGLVYPILGAFRANVSVKAWKAGRFEWHVEPEVLLGEVVDQLCARVREALKDANNDPAAVGKRSGAYTVCYQDVRLHILDAG